MDSPPCDPKNVLEKNPPKTTCTHLDTLQCRGWGPVTVSLLTSYCFRQEILILLELFLQVFVTGRHFAALCQHFLGQLPHRKNLTSHTNSCDWWNGKSNTSTGAADFCLSKCLWAKLSHFLQAEIFSTGKHARGLCDQPSERRILSPCATQHPTRLTFSKWCTYF